MTDEVVSNAWRGIPTDSRFGPGAQRWGLGQVDQPVVPAAPPAHDPWDWRHEKVGWGLVLADTTEGSSADKARARDAPEPLQQLVADRGGAPVLRWRPSRPEVLLRYYPGFADPEPIPIGGTPRGVAAGAIPSFLMLWGDLAALPWLLQYRLNLDPRLCAGRLPLTGDALERYITALRTQWDSPPPSRASTLVWATDHAARDITHLMRIVIADEVNRLYEADDDIDVTYRHSAAATGQSLAEGLAASAPRMVVTTSHGFTGPTRTPDRERLGWLVDADLAEVDPATVVAGWAPAGAVWYAHACCGAGADGRSSFAGVFEANSPLDRMVTELAGLGGLVSPLPVALLGADKPLRAFIGHVEPTFDWTLRHGPSRHALTADLMEALYTELMLGRPIGWAFRLFHGRAGADAADHHDTRLAVLAGDAPPDDALRARLSFLDRRSLVILGDPAVALPPAGQPGGRVGSVRVGVVDDRPHSTAAAG